MCKAKEIFETYYQETREVDELPPLPIGRAIRRFIKEADRTPRDEVKYEETKQQLLKQLKKSGL